MPQKIGLVIDSACDLPRSFIEQQGLEIMPVVLHFGNMTFKDMRDPEQTMDFYRRFVAEKDLEISTTPLSTKAIRDLFLDQLVLKYDRVLVITVSSRRSPVFENATQASFMILSGYKERRRAAGLDEQFGLRVIDSKTLFTGQAVVVYEALRAVRGQEDIMFDKLRQHVENFSQHVHAYVVPQIFSMCAHALIRKAIKASVGSSIRWEPCLISNPSSSPTVVKRRPLPRCVATIMPCTNCSIWPLKPSNTAC